MTSPSSSSPPSTSRPPRAGRQLADLGPVEQLRAGRLVPRLSLLLVGLFLYGASMALVVRSVLGLIPWDVLHVGLQQHVPLSFGTVVVAVSVLVLLLWVPLRQKPGLGTLANAFLIGPSADLVLAVLPQTEDLGWRVVLLVAGIVLNGVATGMYIGSQFGPGPRDGLMTGLARVSGRSIRLVRTLLEVTVVAVGWLLGGVVGVGTVLYALAIGPLAHVFLPLFTVDLPPRDRAT
ncbi:MULTISPECIES: YitT family protein [unclassified Ornithinimicrobium]|uniref:membrane protein YczE n=1 Tax=unclassified Ornithinimicrobium TaxID=2615080 RepID=UPI0038531B21